uniref:Uncharacterized protein n=1 Tax=Arundo donax TaxID=35708 RepID=A0A0A9AC43_ARUDO
MVSPEVVVVMPLVVPINFHPDGCSSLPSPPASLALDCLDLLCSSAASISVTGFGPSKTWNTWWLQSVPGGSPAPFAVADPQRISLISTLVKRRMLFGSCVPCPSLPSTLDAAPWADLDFLGANAMWVFLAAVLSQHRCHL